jgi:hypothetical protein
VTVYVDELKTSPLNSKWKYKKYCHMSSDDLMELEKMAVKIGLKAEWFQDKNIKHYDLTESKRKMAIMNGAVEINNTEFVMKFHKKWKNPKDN